MILSNTLKTMVFFICSVLFYTWLSYQIGSNSDNMSSLLIAKDLASGNSSLSGWSLSTQSYLFSDIIWTALAIKLVGYSPALAHIMPAIFYSLFSYLSLRIVYDKNKGGILLIAPVVLIPSFFIIANAIELNIHGGIYLLSMICLYCISKESLRSPLIKLLIASLLCGIFAESDKLIIFIFIIPCFISSSIQFAVKRQNKDFIIALACCLSIMVYLILSLALPSFFDYNVPGIGSQSIASIHEIAGNATLAIQGLLLYFSINFDSDSIGITISIAKAILLIIYVALFVVAMVRGFGKNAIDTLLIFTTAVPFGAFIFSKVAIDITSTRFLFFSVVSATLLIARNIEVKFKAYKVALIILSICNLAWIYNKPETEEVYYSRLGDYLQYQNLLNGYGEFWKASIVTAVSKVHIYPVDTDGSIRPRNWLSREDWYSRNGNFFISRDSGEIQTAIDQFGPPSKHLKYQSMSILVWNEMPMPPHGVSFKRINENSLPLRNYNIDPDGGIRSNGQHGFFLSGPYVKINKGKYRVVMSGRVYSGKPYAEVFSANKSISIKLPLSNLTDGNIIDDDVYIDKDVDDLELRINIESDEEVKIYGYTIHR